MKRVLALLAAVAMVAGAFALRDARDGDDGGDVAAGARTGAEGDGPADRLRLHCASELAEACADLAEADDRVEVADERAGATADALLAGEVAADVWLAPRPWVELVRELAEGEPPLGEPSDVLARSPLVLVASDTTAPACGGEPVGWRCIGDTAADLRPGVPDLDDTAGLFAVAQAGTAYFGGEEYKTNDFEVPPEAGGPPFVDWVAGLLRAVPQAPPGLSTPLDSMLRVGTATYDFAASIEAVATTSITGTRQEGELDVLYPAPVATVDVVAVPVTGGTEAATSELVELLAGDAGRQALADAGWRVEGAPLAQGLDESVPLEAEDGLPEPGVLAALRARVR